MCRALNRRPFATLRLRLRHAFVGEGRIGPTRGGSCRCSFCRGPGPALLSHPRCPRDNRSVARCPTAARAERLLLMCAVFLCSAAGLREEVRAAVPGHGRDLPEASPGPVHAPRSHQKSAGAAPPALCARPSVPVSPASRRGGWRRDRAPPARARRARPGLSSLSRARGASLCRQPLARKSSASVLACVPLLGLGQGRHLPCIDAFSTDA